MREADSRQRLSKLVSEEVVAERELSWVVPVAGSVGVAWREIAAREKASAAVVGTAQYTEEQQAGRWTELLKGHPEQLNVVIFGLGLVLVWSV